jgi:hypothetical protein
MSISPSVRIALHKSVIIISVYAYGEQWLQVGKANYLFGTYDREKATKFTLNITDNTKFNIYTESGEEIHMAKNDNESMRVGGGNEHENFFFFARDRSGASWDAIDLEKTTFNNLQNDGKHYYIKNVITGRAFGLGGQNGSYRSWRVEDGERSPIKITIITPGPLNSLFEKMITSRELAKCCTDVYNTGKTKDEQKQIICNSINYNPKSDRCDTFMTNYCRLDSNSEDLACSCMSSLYIERELDKLNPSLKKYRDILKTTPYCWMQDCNLSGYQNPNMRLKASDGCDIQICSQEMQVFGDSNILTNSGGQQLCNREGEIMIHDQTKLKESKNTTTEEDNTYSNDRYMPPPPPPEDDEESTNYLFYVFLFFVVILFVAAIYKKNNNSENNYPPMNVPNMYPMQPNMYSPPMYQQQPNMYSTPMYQQPNSNMYQQQPNSNMYQQQPNSNMYPPPVYINNPSGIPST